MIATVNPCGFAMLPAYLALFLGSRDDVRASASTSATPSMTLAGIPVQVARAVVVTVVVTAGFVLLFGGVGALISLGGRAIVKAMPWVGLAIGVGLVALGIAMFTGRSLHAGFAARLASRMGDPSRISPRGFFVFGIGYATASLSCTLPIFLTVVGSSLAVSGLAHSAFQFVSYALGMGSVILALTVSMALFKGAVLGGLRRLIPYVERTSAVLLVVAGAYIVYYWLFKGELLDKLL